MYILHMIVDMDSGHHRYFTRLLQYYWTMYTMCMQYVTENWNKIRGIFVLFYFRVFVSFCITIFMSLKS